MVEPKFPDVYVPLVGQDGNAFSIMGRVSDALRKAEYRNEAMSGDYNNLLRVTAQTVNVGVSPEESEDDDWDDD